MITIQVWIYTAVKLLCICMWIGICESSKVRQKSLYTVQYMTIGQEQVIC